MKLISQASKFCLICTNVLRSNLILHRNLWFQNRLVSQNTEFLLGKSEMLFLHKRCF